jgi:hypothetical protein
MTKKELDERIDELIKQNGSFKMWQDELSFQDYERLNPDIKQLIRDCIAAVTPEVEAVDDAKSQFTPDFYIGVEQTIDTIIQNTKELLGDKDA